MCVMYVIHVLGSFLTIDCLINRFLGFYFLIQINSEGIYSE